MAHAPVPDVLWVPFREGSGSAAGALVGVDCALNGSGTWATGPGGQGFGWGNLSGGGYATTNSSLTYGSDIVTVCAWAFMDRFVPYPGVAYQSNGAAHAFSLDTGHRFAFLLGATSARAEDYPYSGWTANAWHHWAVIWDNSSASGEITMYYDGVLQTPTTTDASKDGSASFTAGTFSMLGTSGGGATCRARISDMRIYGRALTQAEILAIIYPQPVRGPMRQADRATIARQWGLSRTGRLLVPVRRLVPASGGGASQLAPPSLSVQVVVVQPTVVLVAPAVLAPPSLSVSAVLLAPAVTLTPPAVLGVPSLSVTVVVVAPSVTLNAQLAPPSLSVQVLVLQPTVLLGSGAVLGVPVLQVLLVLLSPELVWTAPPRIGPPRGGADPRSVQTGVGTTPGGVQTGAGA